MKRLVVNINDDDLHAKFKRIAFEEQTDMKTMIIEDIKKRIDIYEAKHGAIKVLKPKK